jgi:hypothetical protein
MFAFFVRFSLPASLLLFPLVQTNQCEFNNSNASSSRNSADMRESISCPVWQVRALFVTLARHYRRIVSVLIEKKSIVRSLFSLLTITIPVSSSS